MNAIAMCDVPICEILKYFGSLQRSWNCLIKQKDTRDSFVMIEVRYIVASIT